jgi:hypothetical protein
MAGYPVVALSFSPDMRHLAMAGDSRTVRAMDLATGMETLNVNIEDSAKALAFSPDGRQLAVGCTLGNLNVFEFATGKEISGMRFKGWIAPLIFSPDGKYLAAGGFEPRVFDASWFNPQDKTSDAWLAWLRLQSGSQCRPDGRLGPLSAWDLVAAQGEVLAFLSGDPEPQERWQHAVLKWCRIRPEERHTSPWTGDPICQAVGRWLMGAAHVSTIADCAHQAPWHPLLPLALARLAPKPDDKTDTATREAMLTRARFLSRLTLKRLLEADEKLYGRDTLAEYAIWAAKIMHEELNLDVESKEAFAFALERTPKDRQQAVRALMSTKQAQKVASPDFAQVTIMSILTGSQAERVGLQVGDVLLRYNGQQITSTEQMIKLTGETPGDSIPIEARRGSNTLKFVVKQGRLGAQIENRR